MFSTLYFMCTYPLVLKFFYHGIRLCPAVLFYDIFCILSSTLSLSHHFFFFFQAEDGIRDSSVTGVQTCALPIWIEIEGIAPPFSSDQRSAMPSISIRVAMRSAKFSCETSETLKPLFCSSSTSQIGRASCRERV